MLWFNVSPSVFRLIHCFYTAVCLYLLFGLVRHFYIEHCAPKTSWFNCCKDKASSNSKSKQSQKTRQRRLSGYKTNHFMHRASELMIVLSLLAGALTFAHVLLDLWAFSVQNTFSLQTLCQRQKWSGVILFTDALCVYTFLWIRQRVFYSHPVLRNLSSPILNRFSWSVLFTIIFSILMFTIAYYSIPPDKGSDSGQIKQFDFIVDHSSNIWRVVYNYQTTNSSATNSSSISSQYICTLKSKVLYLSSHFIITGTFLYFQISLQFLFAYPVMKRKYQSKGKSDETKKNQVNNQGHKKEICKPLMIRNESSTTSCDLELCNTVETSSNSEVKKKRATSRLFASYSLPASPRLNHSFSDGSVRAINNNALYRKCFELASNRRTNQLQYENEKTSKNAQSLCNQCSSSESKLTSLKYANEKQKIDLLVRRNTSKNRKPKKNMHRRIRRYVWRCFFVSLMCCVSDVAAFAVNVYTQARSHDDYIENFADTLNETAKTTYLNSSISNNKFKKTFEERVTISLLSVVAYNGNMIINLLGMILCYDKCSEMLFPCCVKRCSKKSKNNEV